MLNIRALQAWAGGPPEQAQWEWEGLDAEGLKPREGVLSTLLRHRGRRVLLATFDLIAPSREWYLPLFRVNGREHGLLAFGRGEILQEETDWSIIWDVDQDDPQLPNSRLFLLDGRLKMGLFSHDDVFFPCLCRYPLGLALQVAKSLVPFATLSEADFEKTVFRAVEVATICDALDKNRRDDIETELEHLFPDGTCNVCFAKM